jgi:HEAT repeat protein
MTHVFISYARRDGQAHANRLDAVLQAAGRDTWLDRRGIDPARDFTAEIETAIRAASHVVACITPDTERADSFVRREIQYALMVDKPILVARVERAAIPPIHIVNNTFIEFYKDWDGGVRQLLDYLDRPANTTPRTTADHPLRGYVQRLYESANQHLETAIIRLIDLDIDDSPEAVPARPQLLDDIALLFGDARTETTFTTFAEAFAHFNRRALLLGEPGGGKTVTLMATARQAAADWLNDPDHNPLPILALISTWDSSKQPSLVDWLGGKKDLSPEPVRELMNAGRALLLLDGLDELGAERSEKRKDERTGQEIEERYDPRQRFIAALNAELDENATLVTCREEEYNAIGQQAALAGAVTLRQLTDEQIRAYLSADPGLAPLQAAIDADEGLRQMSRTPLLLSYLAFGFRDRPEALRDLKDLSEGDLRDAVFMSYMDKRYDREVKRLAKMGLEPPFTLEFIKEVLGRVAMENCGGMRRRKGYGYHKDNVLDTQDFALILSNSQINMFTAFCLDLHYLSLKNEGLGFIHLRLRDSLAFAFALVHLYDDSFYFDEFYPNPAVALGSMRDKRALKFLLGILEEARTQSFMLAMAVSGLGQLGSRIAVSPIIEMLSHSSETVRHESVIALALLRDPKAVEPLILCLKDKSYLVRAYAAAALGIMGDIRAVNPLIQALSDQYRYVNREIVKALGRLKDISALEVLVRALKHHDEEVRSNAAFALGELGDNRAQDALIQTLNDSRYTVGLTAANSLLKLGNVPLKPIVQALSGYDPTLRVLAAYILGKLNDTKAVEPLIATLKDEYAGVRQRSAVALGNLKDVRAVVPLIHLLEDIDPAIRATVATSLEQIGTPEALAAVAEWRARGGDKA